MKKLLLIALLLALSTGVAIAQGQGSGQGSIGGSGGHGNGMAGGHGNFGNPLDRMTEQLGLNEAQVAAIAAIFDENQALRDEEREKSRLISCDIRANTQAQILGILTPEQIAIHEELQLQREEFRRAYEDMQQSRGRSGFGNGPGKPDCDS